MVRRARVAIAGVLAMLSLPYWLPRAVVRLRTRVFTWVNGAEGVAIPGDTIDAAHFMRVYGHPAANGRSRGAALSDLFWYWLSPGPQVHQEHLEAGPRYEAVARSTRCILAVPPAGAERLAARCTARVLDELDVPALTAVRLREVMMPVWADFYYDLVFGEQCPPPVRELVVGNAEDVVSALKGCRLRHMDRRLRLTAFLVDRLRGTGVPHRLPGGLSIQEQAWYLQGTFFNTAVVQMSEAMAHLLLAIAQHPDAQARLVEDPNDDRYLDHVIAETMRLYPLFGVAHRIATGAIEVGDGTTIPAGAVLCFNYPAYHRVGYDQPDRFDPDRWERLSARTAHHIPFGVVANRPCPARGIAPVTMRAATREVLARFVLRSSAGHTRSLPNRGPCLLAPRSRSAASRGRLATALLAMQVRDRWEDVWRSTVQLVLGSYMVWDANRQRLSGRYFDGMRPAAPAADTSPAAPGADPCPATPAAP